MIYGFLFSRLSVCDCVKCSTVAATERKITTSSVVVGGYVLRFVDNLFYVRMGVGLLLFWFLHGKMQEASSGYISVIVFAVESAQCSCCRWWILFVFFVAVLVRWTIMRRQSVTAMIMSSNNHLEGPTNDSNFIKVISSSFYREYVRVFQVLCDNVNTGTKILLLHRVDWLRCAASEPTTTGCNSHTVSSLVFKCTVTKNPLHSILCVWWLPGFQRRDRSRLCKLQTQIFNLMFLTDSSALSWTTIAANTTLRKECINLTSLCARRSYCLLLLLRHIRNWKWHRLPHVRDGERLQWNSIRHTPHNYESAFLLTFLRCTALKH